MMEQRLREIVSGSEDEINLAEAALLVATHACPGLDVPRYLARIDELGAALGSRIPADATVSQRIAALNQYLFGDLGFAANTGDYYDPRNSFLHDVLERRVGIPITLSILYMEVGRRVGLPLQGVSFPGHFLVKCALSEGLVVLDPYSGGISLGLSDLQKRLREVQGGEVSRAIIAGLLVAAGKKDIILRMLRNLKAIYLREQELDKGLAIMNWIVAAAPDQPLELRDRGMVYHELECSRAALADFEQYLRRSPAAEDAYEIRKRIIELQKEAARLN
jgi:regulator of sirC expression with transglutaminase-like and TPR domain